MLSSQATLSGAEITAASTFWPAEKYHQDYWAKNPDNRYCNAFIPSKLEKLGLER